MLALTFIATASCGALLLGTDVGRLALLDQWERTGAALGLGMDAARYAAMERASRNGVAYAVAVAFAGGPVLAIGLAALIFGIFSRARGGTATYRQVLAIVAHAGVILSLRQVVAAPLDYGRETLASPLTLNALVTVFDEASPVARFFAMLDLFVLWWIAVLAIGVSALYGCPPRRVALGFMGTYLALAVTVALAVAIMGGTA
jgi:hypothetical protein